MEGQEVMQLLSKIVGYYYKISCITSDIEDAQRRFIIGSNLAEIYFVDNMRSFENFVACLSPDINRLEVTVSNLLAQVATLDFYTTANAPFIFQFVFFLKSSL